jgi:ABC-type sugar transport system ATPase subunit
MGAVLSARELTKSFPGVKALDRINFDLEAGEIHAVVGENGAGKSTLISVLGGIYQPDEGAIYVDSRRVMHRTAIDAINNRIAVVYQELSLIPAISVAENIFIGRLPRRPNGLIDWKALHKKAVGILGLLTGHIDPTASVKDLPLAKQQLVEILKAISYDPRILILDEPTSCLTQLEIDDLFRIIRSLQKGGVSIVYISHHLEEIFKLADRVTVLKDGKGVATRNMKDVNESVLVDLMVGREIINLYDRGDSVITERYFEIKDFSRGESFQHVNLSLRKGELLGIYGLVGSGRTELAQSIFGILHPESGEMYLEGKRLSNSNPKEAIRNGIGYMTEDRKTSGLFLKLSYKTNCIAPQLSRFCNKLGLVDEERTKRFAVDCKAQYKIVLADLDRPVFNLSGGNQQKVLLSMWIGIRPRVLIVDEPTKGVDIGSRNDIYMSLKKLSQSGVGIIFISSDLPEILGVSDRILVMREGSMVAEFPATYATEQSVVGAATGV